MAELKNSILGKISGSIGNITARIRNGKNYLASKPAYFNTPDDTASVERRAKFKLAVKFSYAVLKSSGLKSVWRTFVSNNKPPFANLMKINYKFILDNDLSALNLITPSEGFSPGFSNVVLTNANLSADLAPLDGLAPFDTNIETILKLSAVVYLSNPANESYEEYDFISLESDNVPLQLINPESFSIDLKSFEGSKVDNYQDKMIFLAAYTLDDEGIPIHFSSTFIQ